MGGNQHAPSSILALANKIAYDSQHRWKSVWRLNLNDPLEYCMTWPQVENQDGGLQTGSAAPQLTQVYLGM